MKMGIVEIAEFIQIICINNAYLKELLFFEG